MTPSVPAGYQPIIQAAERLGMHHTWLQKLCKMGRVPGAQQVARGKRNLWYVPMSVTAAQFLQAPIEGPLRAARCALRLLRHRSGA